MCYSDPLSVIILIVLSYPPVILNEVKNLLVFTGLSERRRRIFLHHRNTKCAARNFSRARAAHFPMTG